MKFQRRSRCYEGILKKPGQKSIVKMRYLCSLTLIILILTSSALSQTTPQVIKIGLIGPLTGPASGYGISQKRGVEMAVDEINSSGELGNKKIELAIADDHARMDLEGELTVELIYNQGIVALIGAINSACTHVSQLVTIKAQVPQITTASTDPSITRAGNPWIFRILVDDVQQGRALAEYIFNQRGFKKIALMRQNNRYGKMGIREIKRIAEEIGCPPVAFEVFNSGQEDFTAQLQRIKDSGAEAVVIWGLYREAGLITRQMREMGIDIPIFGSDGLSHPKFLTIAGPASEGVIVTYPFDPARKDSLTQRFVRNFRKRYGQTPDSYAAHGYDAMYILKEAIKNAGPYENNREYRKKIRDYIASKRVFHGVTKEIVFDEMGNDMGDVVLARIIDGKYVPFYKPDVNFFADEQKGHPLYRFLKEF